MSLPTEGGFTGQGHASSISLAPQAGPGALRFPPVHLPEPRSLDAASGWRAMQATPLGASASPSLLGGFGQLADLTCPLAGLGCPCPDPWVPWGWLNICIHLAPKLWRF